MMSPFRRLSRAYGSITPVLQQAIARDIDGLIDDLIGAALDRWHAVGWARFDDLEVNCTLQLFRWMQEVGRLVPELRILTVQLEWSQPTPSMIAGTESAATMTRPDLRVQIARVAGRSIECKRLAITGGLPRRYVDEGMIRFVSGNYGTTESKGLMVGYVQAGDPAAVARSINSRVAAHPAMGAPHQLAAVPSVFGLLSRHRSSHIRSGISPIVLDHYHVDLR